MFLYTQLLVYRIWSDQLHPFFYMKLKYLALSDMTGFPLNADSINREFDVIEHVKEKPHEI